MNLLWTFTIHILTNKGSYLVGITMILMADECGFDSQQKQDTFFPNSFESACGPTQFRIWSQPMFLLRESRGRGVKLTANFSIGLRLRMRGVMVFIAYRLIMHCDRFTCIEASKANNWISNLTQKVHVETRWPAAEAWRTWWLSRRYTMTSCRGLVYLEAVQKVRDDRHCIHNWYSHLDKLSVMQPLKNFPTFYGPPRFITVFTRALLR
jgi:hypothetical protein